MPNFASSAEMRVGHHDGLFGRSINATPTILDQFKLVGTDFSSRCGDGASVNGSWLCIVAAVEEPWFGGQRGRRISRVISIIVQQGSYVCLATAVAPTSGGTR